ncbi:hypothetical protein [Nonomuraea lactucae]|uniref:hypothetical protein n=1 Tax=Nonomuraea lactucae TaxID=2249762 RepID=UPI000DE23F82|nr:hypothetical protein [Nonomuraea lactucae]
MADQPHARWTDAAFAPVDVSDSGTYPGVPAGPVRRAELRDAATGQLLGHVWADNREAAGFADSDEAGAAGVRAGARVWRILADTYQAGRPASDVLDPSLFEPDYQLVITD